MSNAIAGHPSGEGRPDPLSGPLPDAGPDAGPDASPDPSPDVGAASAAAPASVGPDRPAADPAATEGTRRDSVVCPECGTRSEVRLTRREAADFCPRCDFPLFWTPSTIQLGDRATAEAALRRLPGTAGRVTVAAASCPHCNEANPLSATVCGRCGQPLVVEPPPAPVAAPPPPPPPAPEPEPRSLWWLWLVMGLTGALLVALVLWLVLR